jgi:hypothetical protein
VRFIAAQCPHPTAGAGAHCSEGGAARSITPIDARLVRAALEYRWLRLGDSPRVVTSEILFLLPSSAQSFVKAGTLMFRYAVGAALLGNGRLQYEPSPRARPSGAPAAATGATVPAINGLPDTFLSSGTDVNDPG